MKFFTKNISEASRNGSRTVTLLLLKLLILLCTVKFAFVFFNKGIIRPDEITNSIPAIIKWSVGYDLLILLFINTPFIVLLFFFQKVNRNRIPIFIITTFFLILNTLCLLINVTDIFYFPFHFQRADADLLYVIADPIQKSFIRNPFPSVMFLLFCFAFSSIIFLIHKTVYKNAITGASFIIPAFIMSFLLLYVILFEKKKLLPSYPLTELNSSQTLIVQNSLHTFLYSVYRREEAIVTRFTFLTDTLAVKQFPLRVAPGNFYNASGKKNVVLFIMESIPADFFEKNGKYNARMPFLDSLVNISRYYDNAFSYSHNSNKGIVAILEGIPTLTEIPLYHSGYSGIEKTGIGSVLSEIGYHTSFFIGDSYDDFGFAKCCNWMGIENYYCKDNMPSQKDMHTMGLHDKYVLDFMGNKLNEYKQPFFAVNYNISTHFPNDLPEKYEEKYRNENLTGPMKAMNYYNESLERFFNYAHKQPWFSNTVFIFCSDHWMYPDEKSIKTDIVQGFRIPIFIYDPSDPVGRLINHPVSQLDIVKTILDIAGSDQPHISYGKNLLDTNVTNRVVFSKENSNLYQAFDSTYVLGFNSTSGKTEFIYNYKEDKLRKRNLVNENFNAKDNLTYRMKLFLQVSSMHYKKKHIN